MVTIGMNYNVLPGKENAFEQAFKAVITALSKAEGHTKSRLYHDVDEPGNYLIMSQWENEDAYQSFITSEAFRSVTNWGKENILAGRPSHQLYK